jgi:hypothetical protein
MSAKHLYCSGLPPVAFMDDPTEPKQVSAVLIGESGHYPIPPGDKFYGNDARTLNRRFAVTDAQAQAMVIGSMCGWDVPGACVHDQPCAVVRDCTEEYEAGQLDWAMEVFHRVLDAAHYEVITSGDTEEGIGGRQITPDPEKGVFIRARRDERVDIGGDSYSVRVRNVGREYGSERWFEIEAHGDLSKDQSLALRVSLSSDGDAIDAALQFAFETLDRWNRGEE